MRWASVLAQSIRETAISNACNITKRKESVSRKDIGNMLFWGHKKILGI